MDWLNYHHLLYFWTVARAGGLAAAAKELHLSLPTISVQIRRLEESLGEKLFERAGRRLALTEVGKVVYRFADEIFTLGREMVDTLEGRPTGRPLRLIVGVADVLPKIVAHRLIAPALDLPERVHVVCREASPERLLMALASQELDVVLTDAPVGADFKVRAHNHLLGESGMSFVCAPGLARRCRRGFPRSLAEIPMLLPTENMAVRRDLDQWFAARGVRPDIVGEFEDYALLREFGASGHGVFAVPSVIERPLRRAYHLELIGRVGTVRARFYVISLERRIKNPAVAAICDVARAKVFRE
ncbi:MAG: transcriptional activator NhaR [Vicinamibacteria bacterium]|nr:transcriptional activator NhaR [Vicinamibacteria bacterium]